MPDRSNVRIQTEILESGGASPSNDVFYVYDGSFEGLLCCVYESFYEREFPAGIVSEVGEEGQLPFGRQKRVETDLSRAERVARSVTEKISGGATALIESSFLTCLENKEMFMLDFLRKGFRHGERIMDMLTDDSVRALTRAVRQMGGESHKLCGFTRFSVYGDVKVAVIGPKNFVLPLLRNHFCERFHGEEFMIYDERHGCALVCRPPETAIIPVDKFVLERPDRDELKYRQLWRKFYDTIAVQARYNPRCRMNHMPKRYWDYMTEFGSSAVRKYETGMRTQEVTGRGNYIAGQ